MREIRFICLHCTATPQTTSVTSILNFWKNVLHWINPGYHYLINPDGSVRNLQLIEKPSNGVAGHNANSIHISYIGGVDKNNKPLDNRTDAQVQAQIDLIKYLKKKFPDAKILGHRDFLKKGSSNWKDCPSFDVNKWIQSVGL